MFSKILLGLIFAFFAFEHYRGREWIISNKIKNRWTYKKRINYQKTLVLPYALLGCLFIVMGIVEYLSILSVTDFLLLYIGLASVILIYSAFKVIPFFKD